jgi:putative phosphoesterase
MLIALLSDIHGNADALKAALYSENSIKYGKVIVSGDIVGYYYEPHLVLQMLSDFDYYLVRGNHEVMLNSLRSNPDLSGEINQKYGSALDRALISLPTEVLDLLCNAPDSLTLNVDNLSINISHGAPWKIDEYLYPNANQSVWSEFLNYSEDIFIIGNTHHQLIKRLKGKLIINPGSIGQSRTNPGMAQWAEFNTETLDVTFRSVNYDSSRVLKRCIENDPSVDILRKYL